jgi:hypothetical protein
MMSGRISLTLTLALFAVTGKAQDGLLVNFSGQQIENYIHLDFTVRGGVSCSGTEIERSADDVHFETIGIIPGICGSSISDESYSFDDSVPQKNQLNYYRINFGQLGYSQSIRLQFVDYGNGFVLFNNPGAGTVSALFSNPDNKEITFSLIDLRGRILQSVTTRGDDMLIHSGLLLRGIYILQLKDEGTILHTSKIVFQ